MDNYLKHHGILGQKWGVRRYQNEDGTLTPAGKERLQAYKKKETDKAKVRWENAIYRNSEGISKKKYNIEKYKSRGDSRRERREKEALERYKTNRNKIMEYKAKELKAIKNLTFDQMQDEKHERMRDAGISLVGGAAASVALTAAINAPLISSGYNLLADAGFMTEFLSGLGVVSALNYGSGYATGDNEVTRRRIDSQSKNRRK